MNWLTEILEDLQLATYTGDDAEKTIRKDFDMKQHRAEAIEAITTKLKEAIGEDEGRVVKFNYWIQDTEQKARNQLRAEIRKELDL